MRRFLLLLCAAALACTCTKLDVGSGRYSAVVSDGTLNIELLDGRDCILYFDGGKESTGRYWIEGKQIFINGHAVYESKTKYRWYDFSQDRPGTIDSRTKFSIVAEVGDDTRFCTFLKRQ